MKMIICWSLTEESLSYPVLFFFFFQRGKISAVSTHDRKHQTHSQGSFPLALTGPLNLRSSSLCPQRFCSQDNIFI